MASILGSVVALLGLIQSQAWLTVLGTGFAGVSLVAIVSARRSRTVLRSARLTLEGLNLDSLNLANLRRRLNRSLVVQRAFHFAKIEGRNLTVAWQYEGFCRSKMETSIEFSIDSDANVPFHELDCFAFDLQQDPNREHKIRPILLGNDGLSKKIAVPFLKPPEFQQPFRILLNCTLPDSVGSGIQYYTSSLSFDQRSVERLAVHLIFVRRTPGWVRVYECDAHGRPALISELRPFKNDGRTCEYADLVEDIGGQAVRIYLYNLGPGEDLERLAQR
jgi:hypothetical protein